MNERIGELAEQCRIETYGVNGELLTFGFDEEKFAKLIIRECADFVAEGEFGDPGAANELKKYFGMEKNDE